MDSTNIGNETISLKSILIGYLRHWRLFLGTFVISLIPAVLYLIYYPTTYEVMARLKFKMILPCPQEICLWEMRQV